MKCAKSEVSCENCKERGSCPIYREYMIAASEPYSPHGWVARPIHPHGDEWIGWTVYDIEGDPV